MTDSKLALICAAMFGFAALRGAEPVAAWTFDQGKNIDMETGTTEFDRTKSLRFEGMTSAGKERVFLHVDPKADPARFFVGSPRKKAIRTGTDGEYHFSAHGRLSKPLSREDGAVALWIAPENWDGTQKGPFRIFFAANDKPARSNELLLYKNGMLNNIVFIIGNNDPKQWSQVQTSIWNWKPGEWHFVCASWDRDKLYLYIDGKLFEEKRKALPDSDYQLIHVGTRYWKNEGGLSLIDDLMIFDKTLSVEEMDKIYQSTRPLGNDRQSPVTAHLGKKKTVIDGKIGEFEYGYLSNATFDIKTMELGNGCLWGIARDDGKLYFAAETAAPSRRNTVFTRDGNLWEDESIELHLEYGGKKWQFIVNSDGTLFDSHMNDRKWNIGKFEQKHLISGSRWVMEGAVAFSDLGITPREGDRIYMTICRGGNISGLSAASPLLRNFADRANFIKLVLDPDASPINVVCREFPASDGKLNIGISTEKDVGGEVIFDGMDIRNRKLAGQTVPFRKNGRSSRAEIKTSAMGKEGIISYRIMIGGKESGSANVKYLSAEKVKVRYLRTRIAEQKLETGLLLSPPLPDKLIFEQLLKDRDGKVVLKNSTAAGAKGASDRTRTVLWDISSLAPGDYDYFLNIVEDGKSKPVHHQFFMKPDTRMPWHGFSGGISSDVPAPWHTPEISGSTLKCLMQTYDFTGTLLPKNIIADNEAVISSPLAFRINGKKTVPRGMLEVLSRNGREIKFRTRAKYENIDFEMNGILEYDGFCRLSLSYAPSASGAKVRIDDLALMIHMAPEYSELLSSYKPADTGYLSGKCPANFSKDFFEHPCFWLGSAERGLFIGADSMRGTHVKDSAASLQVSRNGSGAVMTLRFVDCPYDLSGKRTVEFFLQATPTKPIPAKYSRPFMFRGGAVNYVPTTYSRLFNSFQRRFNDMDKLRRIFGSRPPYEIRGIYSAIYGVSPFAPEWPWHVEQWISSPPGLGQFKQDFPLNDEAARNRGMWAFGCVNCRDFLQWQLYNINDFVQDGELGLRDMYFDMAYPRACDNQLHGCGWKDDFGKLRKTYPILANREFTERIAKILKDKDPDSVLMYHPSGEPIPPVLSLADICIDGECFVSQVAREESYYNIFTPELMRSSFIGNQSGTVNVYISQLARSAMMLNPARNEYWRRKVKTPEAVRAVRHYLGYVLLHNIHPQAGAGIYNEGEILEKQLYSLGWSDGNIVFYPYWKKNCPVKTSGRALVSAFKLPKGMLAVIVNDDLKRAEEVGFTRPAGYSGKIYDLESGKTLAETKISVPPKDFRLVVFEER